MGMDTPRPSIPTNSSPSSSPEPMAAFLPSSWDTTLANMPDLFLVGDGANLPASTIFPDTQFDGESGGLYGAEIFPLGYPWLEPIPGVYVITKATKTDDGDVDHCPIFIGYADNICQAYANHPKGRV